MFDIPNFLGLNVFFILLKICVMLGFFPKEGFLEPLSKILIFHGFCSERSYYTFFKNQASLIEIISLNLITVVLSISICFSIIFIVVIFPSTTIYRCLL